MKTKWNISLFKVILLFILGVGVGGEIVLVATNNMSLIGGSLQIIGAIGISIVLLMSCRIHEEHK